MYSKCHMSLKTEMYMTHEISDITGNSYAGNVMCPCIENVHEM